jgi:Ca2+-dependent lipid-binding protein
MTKPTLKVTLLNATDLIPMDWNGSSDPFAVLEVGTQQFTSKKVGHSLNPTWNESFEFEVCDPSRDVLTVRLYDYDVCIPLYFTMMYIVFTH